MNDQMQPRRGSSGGGESDCHYLLRDLGQINYILVCHGLGAEDSPRAPGVNVMLVKSCVNPCFKGVKDF